MNIDRYHVKLTFTEPLLGAVPRNRDVYADYIASKAPRNTDTAEELNDLEEVEVRGWTGFHKDENGLYLLDYAIKGFVKEAGNLLKEALGKRALRAKLDNVLFVKPRKIHIQRDGRILARPDGVIERPLRGMTPQGPRVSLARSDYVDTGSQLEFTLDLLQLPNIDIRRETLCQLFDYGAYKGLGQFRNGGYGRFRYDLTPAATD